MTDQQNRALYIADQLRKAGVTLAGAAGVLINMEAESLISETNGVHSSRADRPA